MKDYKTDSTANLSRFARDKRQRVSSTERVERSPRPRREADNEGQREFRPKTTNVTKRTSYNPHFTADNRLHPKYENSRRGEERTERFERTERPERGGFNRPERTERTERKGREFGSSERTPRQPKRDDFRPKSGGDSRSFGNKEGYKGGAKRTFAPKRDEKPHSYPKYNPNKQTGEVRLNRFISQSGICSRREADDFILAGVVTVNGQVVTELGTKILPTDEVRFNDERLQGEKNVYIVLNKPKGYVTTASDPHADKTVMDLLKGCGARVFPVGRLDKNTTGVLMFTNDGEIAEKLTHPSYDKKKIYQVSLDSKLRQEDFEKILSGIELSDGMIAADELEYIEEDDHRKLGIEIHSGKNRIVRRIFESLGYEVKALDRVYFAGLTKKGLKRGEWRFLTEGETNLLKMGAYL